MVGVVTWRRAREKLHKCWDSVCFVMRSAWLLCFLNCFFFHFCLVFLTPGPYCNATTDQIGTCWPRTSAGELVERPCPEFFNGIKYNTTSKYKLLSSPADLAFRRHLGTPKIYFHYMEKKNNQRKKKKVCPNISSTFQPVYSQFLPGMMHISQKRRLVDTVSSLLKYI